MEQQIKKDYERLKKQFNAAAEAISFLGGEIPVLLVEAMKYSLVNGGKRYRPLLLLESARLTNCSKYAEVMPLALAVECIHTYSLIHDDLPSMDDDDERRGKPSSHKVYGEAIAILAGDALLNLAYEILLEGAVCASNHKDYLRAALMISKAAGCRGMVGGQVLDITIEPKDAKDCQILNIHKKKTAALISAAVTAGAVAAGASEEQLMHFKKYGDNIGLAFQLADDIADGDSDETPSGLRIYGKEQADSKLTEYIENATTALENIKGDTKNLILMAEILKKEYAHEN